MSINCCRAPSITTAAASQLISESYKESVARAGKSMGSNIQNHKWRGFPVFPVYGMYLDF